MIGRINVVACGTIFSMNEFQNEPVVKKQRSRFEFFAYAVVGFILLFVIDFYIFKEPSLLFSTLSVSVFVTIWGRTYSKEFPASKFSFRRGFEENFSDKLEPGVAEQVAPTQEDLSSATALQRIVFQHHRIIFWMAILVLIILTAWVWHAGDLNAALGL